jgi:hypothetical protein
MAATAVSISKAMLVRSCGALNQLLSSESKTDAELIGDFSLNAANVACHEDDQLLFIYILIYIYIFQFPWWAVHINFCQCFSSKLQSFMTFFFMTFSEVGHLSGPGRLQPPRCVVEVQSPLLLKNI